MNKKQKKFFRFGDLKIGTRWWLFVSVILILLGVMFVISYIRVLQLEESFKEVKEESYEMHLVMHVMISLSQVVMPANDYLIVGGDPNEKENFKKLTKILEQRLDNLGPHSLNSEMEREAFLNTLKTYLLAKEKAEQIFAIPRDEAIGSPETGRLMEEMDALIDEAILEIDKWHQFVDEEMIEANKKFMEAERQLALTNYVLILIIFLISLVLGILFIRSILLPAKDLLKLSKRVARGDLSKKIEVKSSDEIGELGMAFNEMIDALKKSKEGVEKTVSQRTVELEELNRHMIGRELKMAELKKEIRELKKKK